MCAIMGRLSATPAPPDDFTRLFGSLAHRGPDAHETTRTQNGSWTVELGHHRLAIIDVGGGRQPMPSGAHTLVFNGEIYNFETLRGRLPDVAWRTRSDSEVVLELLRAGGRDALKELDGFFALGIYDSARNELLLARDRWGIKPLYYAQAPDGGLLFASELHPFLRRQDVRPEVELETVADYLFWDHVPYDRAMLKGVRKLEPGQYLHWRDGQVECASFYDHQTLLHEAPRKIAPESLWDLVSEGVNRALVSDVPVGVLLSGGIDSSMIAAAATHAVGKGLPTFSIGFEEAEFDESGAARQVAKWIGSEHHEHRIGAADMLARWEEIVVGLDEPLADPSLIPTRLLSELAREHVRVVLGGDGGDELFGGYPTYRAQRLRPLVDLIPERAFERLRGWIRSRLLLGDGYQSLSWKLKRLLGRYDDEPIRGHFRWMSGTDFPEIADLAGAKHPPRLRDLGTLDPQELQSYLYLDLRHYLPYSVLTKVDRASMAVGLECRPPLLTNACVERAFAVPSAQKVVGRRTKAILRDAARAHLPPHIVARGKRGFAIPLARWLKGPLNATVESMLHDSPLWEGLSVQSARGLWGEFLAARGDHAKTFWALLVLHKWMAAHGARIAP